MITDERLETLFDDPDTIGVVKQLLAEARREGAAEALATAHTHPIVRARVRDAIRRRDAV